MMLMWVLWVNQGYLHSLSHDNSSVESWQSGTPSHLSLISMQNPLLQVNCIVLLHRSKCTWDNNGLIPKPNVPNNSNASNVFWNHLGKAFHHLRLDNRNFHRIEERNWHKTSLRRWTQFFDIWILWYKNYESVTCALMMQLAEILWPTLTSCSFTAYLNFLIINYSFGAQCNVFLCFHKSWQKQLSKMWIESANEQLMNNKWGRNQRGPQNYRYRGEQKYLDKT